MAPDEDTVREAAEREGLELKALPGGAYVLYDRAIGAHVHELEWGRSAWPSLDGAWDYLQSEGWKSDRDRDRSARESAEWLGWAIIHSRDHGWLLKPRDATIDDDPLLSGPYVLVRNAVEAVAHEVVRLAQAANAEAPE